MTHGIEMIAGRNTYPMAYSGARPWHSHGTHLPYGSPIEEYARIAALDTHIMRAMVRYQTSRDSSTLRSMTGRIVLFREDNGEALGIVSEDYKVFQYRESLEFFRDLITEAGFQLDTVASLFGGKRFFVSAKLPVGHKIKGLDQIEGYLLIASSCDGSMKTEVRYTTVRVECNNLLQFARRAKADVTVSHKSRFDAADVKRQLGLSRDEVQDQFAEAMTQFERLANTTLAPVQTIGLTGRLLAPSFDKMDKADQIKVLKTNAAKTIGSMAINASNIAGDVDTCKNTAWGWVNAVTEYVDHHAKTRGENAEDNRLYSSLFGRGDTLKTRALEIALQHADGSVTYEARNQAETVTDAEFAGLLSRPARINNRPVLSEMVGAGDDGSAF